MIMYNWHQGRGTNILKSKSTWRSAHSSLRSCPQSSQPWWGGSRWWWWWWRWRRWCWWWKPGSSIFPGHKIHDLSTPGPAYVAMMVIIWRGWSSSSWNIVFIHTPRSVCHELNHFELYCREKLDLPISVTHSLCLDKYSSMHCTHTKVPTNILGQMFPHRTYTVVPTRTKVWRPAFPAFVSPAFVSQLEYFWCLTIGRGQKKHTHANIGLFTVPFWQFSKKDTKFSFKHLEIGATGCCGDNWYLRKIFVTGQSRSWQSRPVHPISHKHSPENWYLHHFFVLTTIMGIMIIVMKSNYQSYQPAMQSPWPLQSDTWSWDESI